MTAEKHLNPTRIRAQAVVESLTGLDKPLPLSQPTILDASRVATHLAEGKEPPKGEVSQMVQGVAKDLSAEGPTITPEEVDEVTEKANTYFSELNKKPDGLPEASLTHENIELTAGVSDYEKMLSSVMKTYGLEGGKWKTIAGLLATNEVGWTLLEGLRNRAWTDGLDSMLQNLKDVSKDMGFDKAEARNLTSVLAGDMSKTGGALLKAAKASWPLWSSVVQWFAEGKIHKFGQKLYMQERAKLEDMVNTRVAASLYMRGFSEFHDQNAGKMMQVINRGKSATVELIATTYFDLVPLLAQIGSYPFGQALAYGKEYGKFAALSAAVKIPILAWSSFKSAKEQQAMHQSELAMWDKINTELITTLSNLETLRTAGNTEGHALNLRDILGDKDFVASGGLRHKLSSNRSMDMLFDAMDVGVPVVKNGWEIFKGVRDGASIENIGQKVWSLYMQSRYSKGEQMVVRRAFSDIMNIYVNRIIPHMQDIARMEELLGPYDQLDVPNGPREQARVPVDALTSYDISIKNVGYKNILHDVSMDIPQGSFTAVKGPSGIGKTTLLRQLVGLYEPEEGSITVGGQPIDGIKKYGPQAFINRVGYAGQMSELLEGWTLRDNLLLGTTNVSEQKLSEVMHNLGLDHLKDRLDSTVKHYSGGEKRRIGIARALLKDPKVLILDEPTAHLDAKSTEQVLDIIRSLRKEKPDMTVLAITHDPAFERIAERVLDFAELNKKTVQESLADNQVLHAVARPQKS